MGIDTGDPALPVAGSGTLAAVRKSKTSKWRAGVLLAVHLLVLLHVTHFLARGRTLSPVEPSESMYTLELGQVNAGFVFFALALLSTLAFGRVFCGWGCHLVALQDLCGWLMKRAGIRPRPFRSRLLLWVPLIVALYMFVWPQLKRVVFQPESTFPGFSNQLMTEGFWDTFPGPTYAVITFLVCGFAAVYMLGAKGFCTYGCPYGGLFVIFDRFSAGKIVVNDDCEQCGHCTATCTSNVLVHEEVRRFGRVVDPGCMKCMDCISVCPKEALRFSFSRPSVLKGPPRDRVTAARFPYALREEIFLGAACAFGVFAFWRLYDGPPLLLSVALGGITAFCALKLWHLIRRPTVRLQNLNLKLAGRLSGTGRLVALLVLGWMALAAHSGFVQWHRSWGTFHLGRTEVSQADGISGAYRGKTYSAAHHRSLARMRRHFGIARRWGLAPVAEVELGLAWGALLEDDVDTAAARTRDAIAQWPERERPYSDLVQLLLARGRQGEAIEALQAKIDAVGGAAEDQFTLAGLLLERGRPEEAVQAYRACVALAPDTARVRFNLGGLLRRMERTDEAIDQLEAAARLEPSDPDTQVELGLAYQTAGRDDDAIRAFQRAIALAPDRPESLHHLPRLIEDLRR